MEELVKQIGDNGGLLLLIIPPIIQAIKKIPILVKLQGDGMPIYEIASLALAIGGAYAFGLPTPIVTGAIAWLASGKGYDYLKGQKQLSPS